LQNILLLPIRKSNGKNTAPPQAEVLTDPETGEIVTDPCKIAGIVENFTLTAWLPLVLRLGHTFLLNPKPGATTPGWIDSARTTSSLKLPSQGLRMIPKGSGSTIPS